jgi:SNF1-activating kinase 1
MDETSDEPQKAREERSGTPLHQTKRQDQRDPDPTTAGDQTTSSIHRPDNDGHVTPRVLEAPKPLDQFDRPFIHTQLSTASTATVKASSTGHILPSTAPQTPHHDRPFFPNQAYSALHEQFHPLHAIRYTRPKHQSSYSAVSELGHPQHYEHLDRRSKTAENSPSTTPGLFTPATSPPVGAGNSVDLADGLYSSPYLHYTQRQAPKE